MKETYQLNNFAGFENLADVYHIVRDGDECWVEGRDGKLGVWENHKGYLHHDLYQKDGKKVKCMQHRVFAICFINNDRPEADTVDHIDNNKQNNLLSNLQWLTREENFRKAVKDGLLKETPGSFKVGNQSGIEGGFDTRFKAGDTGEKCVNFKGVIVATHKKTGEVVFLYGGKDQEEKGFHTGHVSACLAGKLKSHRGFTFVREEN